MRKVYCIDVGGLVNNKKSNEEPAINEEEIEVNSEDESTMPYGSKY